MAGTPLPSNDSYLGSIGAYLNGPARPIIVNTALFVAGVAFIQSSLMEYLAPQL